MARSWSRGPPGENHGVGAVGVGIKGVICRVICMLFLLTQMMSPPTEAPTRCDTTPTFFIKNFHFEHQIVQQGRQQPKKSPRKRGRRADRHKQQYHRMIRSHLQQQQTTLEEQVLRMLLIRGGIEQHPGPQCPGGCGSRISSEERMCMTCFQEQKDQAGEYVRKRGEGEVTVGSRCDLHKLLKDLKETDLLIQRQPDSTTKVGIWVSPDRGDPPEQRSVQWFVEYGKTSKGWQKKSKASTSIITGKSQITCELWLAVIDIDGKAMEVDPPSPSTMQTESAPALVTAQASSNPLEEVEGRRATRLSDAGRVTTVEPTDAAAAAAAVPETDEAEETRMAARAAKFASTKAVEQQAEAVQRARNAEFAAQSKNFRQQQTRADESGATKQQQSRIRGDVEQHPGPQCPGKCGNRISVAERMCMTCFQEQKEKAGEYVTKRGEATSGSEENYQTTLHEAIFNLKDTDLLIQRQNLKVPDSMNPTERQEWQLVKVGYWLDIDSEGLAEKTVQWFMEYGKSPKGWQKKSKESRSIITDKTQITCDLWLTVIDITGRVTTVEPTDAAAAAAAVPETDEAEETRLAARAAKFASTKAVEQQAEAVQRARNAEFAAQSKKFRQQQMRAADESGAAKQQQSRTSTSIVLGQQSDQSRISCQTDASGTAKRSTIVLGRPSAVPATDGSSSRTKCPLCSYTPPPTRSAVQLVAHINTRHRNQLVNLSGEACTAARIVVCGECNTAVSDSGNGRAAHVCGAFETRASQINRQRVSFTLPINSLTRDEAGEDQSQNPETRTGMRMTRGTDGARPIEAAGTSAEASTSQHPVPKKQRAHDFFDLMSDDVFFGTRPPMHRYLEKRGWNAFAETVLRHCLRGYAADTDAGKQRRQQRLMEIIRNTQCKQFRADLGNDRSESRTTEQTASEANRRIANRIDALVQIGAVGKARQQLESNSKRLDPDESVMACLEKLHPNGADTTISADLFQTISGITKQEVREIVQHKLARGAAPGMDGWTRELLLPIVQHDEALTEFTAMIDDLLNTNLSTMVLARLLGCPLFALEKTPATAPEGLTVRPIAIESTIIKLLSHLVMGRIDEAAWNATFGVCQNVRQMGVGPGSNLEKAVHEGRRLISEGYTCISIDSINAYNTIDRRRMTERVTASRGLWPIFKLTAYSVSEALLCAIDGRGTTKARVMSREGVRQGSVLGPLLFAITLHPQLCKLATEFPGVRIIAYLDDVNIFIPPTFEAQQIQTGDPFLSQEERRKRSIQAVASRCEAVMREVGLMVNRKKTQLLSTIPDMEIEIGGGVVVASSGVHKMLGAAAAATPTMEAYEAFVNQHMEYTRFFDRLENSEATLYSRMKILQICAMGKPTFLLRTHPPEATEGAATRFDTRVSGCIAKWLGNDAAESRIANLPMRAGGLGLRRAAEVAPLAYAAREKGEQRAATAALDEQVLQEVLESTSEQQQAIITSFAKVQMTEGRDEALHHHLRERLLLPTAPVGVECNGCGEVSSLYHVHSCKGLSAERIARHDHIVRCLRRAAEVRFVVQEEHPVRTHFQTRHKPDLKIYTDGIAEPTLVDVTVTFVGSVSGAGRAIARVENEKRVKYQAVGLRVEPFVIGHTGELGPSALLLLEKILPKKERGTWRAELQRLLMDGNLHVHRGAF